MDENALKALDLELAILYRRITSITAHKKIGNLDRSAYLLLHQIASHGSTGIKSLADEFRLDISTVSRQAASLEQKGYVNKIQNPVDGRSSSLEITGLGMNELKECRHLRLDKLEKVVESWTENERLLFGQLLKKFNHSVIEKSES